MVLLNGAAGEFVVEVLATVELPKPLEAFALQVQSESDGGAHPRMLKMPPKNAPGAASGSADPAADQPGYLDLRRGKGTKRKRDEFEPANVFGDPARAKPPKRRA